MDHQITIEEITGNRMANICFSGPRPVKLPGNGAPDCAAVIRITAELALLIRDAAARGKIHFLTGFMSGFDIIAAEQTVLLKKEFPGIRCVAAAPFRQGYYRTENWTPEWAARARALYPGLDLGISLEPRFSAGVYLRRDDFLVGCSSELICYYDGRRGGTQYTVNQAKKQNLTIRNVYDELKKRRLLNNETYPHRFLRPVQGGMG